MTDYVQTLISICLTMITGVIIIGCIGAMATAAIAIKKMIEDEL